MRTRKVFTGVVALGLLFCFIKHSYGWNVNSEKWLLIGPPELNVNDKDASIRGKSKIHPDICVQGKLLDIKIDYPIIHNAGQGGAFNSSITMKYRIDKANLPTGPIYLAPCWNAFSLTKLPVKIGRKSVGRLGYGNATIGAEGKMWFKGTGTDTVTFNLTTLHSRDSLNSGIHGIDTWTLPGYINDPDNPGIRDELTRLRRWRTNEKFVEQTTILVANLTSYEIKTMYKTSGKAGTPFKVNLTLTDGDGNTYPVPNAKVKATFIDKSGLLKKEAVLEGEFEDDEATMTFRIPTGWYQVDCPMDIEKATIEIKVGMGLPSGEKKKIIIMKVYEKEQGII